jgi:hypothetical protein
MAPLRQLWRRAAPLSLAVPLRRAAVSPSAAWTRVAEEQPRAGPAVRKAHPLRLLPEETVGRHRRELATVGRIIALRG